MPTFAWAPQASDMNVPDPSEILARKAARSQDPLRIGLLGRLTVEKGARIVLDFIDNASAPCEFHVAGNGPLAEEFSKRSEGIAPSPARVVFHGAYDPAHRAEFLRRFFTGIDLLVVPSQDEWETLSMVTLEALQHGTPSLLCRTGGLISFGLPDLGPAPESVVGLVDPHHFKAELARRIAAPRPDPIANGEACIRYYAAHFRDAVIQKRWSDLLAG
jgi:glycosyltransferase involved in cell wall biosynthesis